MQELLSPGSDLLRDRRQRTLHAPRPASGRAYADRSERGAARAGGGPSPAGSRGVERSGRPRPRVTALPETRGTLRRRGTRGRDGHLHRRDRRRRGAAGDRVRQRGDGPAGARTTRRKEIAVRLAMGASRGRVVRQLLTECALLAAAGGALGLLIAQCGRGALSRFRPDEAPAFDLTLDYRIFLFSIAASLLTVVLFGLAPALQTTRPDVNAELKDTARPVRVRGFRFGLRSGLVVIQVALSLALVIGAALMFRSSHAGRTGDPGFRRDGVFSVGINLSTIPDRGGAHARFYQEARALGGRDTRGRSGRAGRARADGRQQQPGDDSNAAGARSRLAGHQRGRRRLFRPARHSCQTRAGSSRPTIANRRRASRSSTKRWRSGPGTATPVGKVFTDENTNELFQVVGVVGDLRHRSFAEEPIPMVYFCAAQRSRPTNDAARADGGAAGRHRARRAEDPARDQSLGRSHAAPRR